VQLIVNHLKNELVYSQYHLEGEIDSEGSLTSGAPAPRHLAAPGGEELTPETQGWAGCGSQAELGWWLRLDAVATL
jgi:hypothetical protein